MTKDFLFFSYSWVDNANFYFKKFEELGYKCDYVYETNLADFKPVHDYQNIVLYLHEWNTIPITNKIIDTYYRFSNLIQHDDTDFEDIQIWSNRKPDLIMHRELTDNSKNPWKSPVYGFHFPVATKYDQRFQLKEIDLSFIGRMTSGRRKPFVEHIKQLSVNELKNMNWHIDVDDHVGVADKITKKYTEVINSSKIGLNYFGNSYDSKRTWELASTKCAIIMPKLKLKSTSKDGILFDSYIEIRDDFQDLKEKILYTMENKRYIDYGEAAYESYTKFHTPEKCFEKYYEIVKNILQL
jgi:hypothetical protein